MCPLQPGGGLPHLVAASLVDRQVGHEPVQLALFGLQRLDLPGERRHVPLFPAGQPARAFMPGADLRRTGSPERILNWVDAKSTAAFEQIGVLEDNSAAPITEAAVSGA
ncbi:MAG: hypothetical protein CVU38_18835 [Chloroflexi bacterium HGW-Chloroflexi-1]|nr:MAG: hypothetical protein CVU38_18835 [Chloroflexi bacterium HGW-Chloroflexi-1]